MLPQARKDELVVQELPEETLVYDLKRHRAYCLNRTAALVWRQCDGQATIPQMASRLRDELKRSVDDAVVWLALNRLDSAHLLEERMERSADGTGYSRREMIRKLGLIGGLAALLPVVQSIVAPTAASAVTCVTNCSNVPNCTPCSNPGGQQCPTRVCMNQRCVKKSDSGCP